MNRAWKKRSQKSKEAKEGQGGQMQMQNTGLTYHNKTGRRITRVAETQKQVEGIKQKKKSGGGCWKTRLDAPLMRFYFK